MNVAFYLGSHISPALRHFSCKPQLPEARHLRICYRDGRRAVGGFSLQNKCKLFRAPQQMMLEVVCVA